MGIFLNLLLFIGLNKLYKYPFKCIFLGIRNMLPPLMCGSIIFSLASPIYSSENGYLFGFLWLSYDLEQEVIPTNPGDDKAWCLIWSFLIFNCVAMCLTFAVLRLCNNSFSFVLLQKLRLWGTCNIYMLWA